VTSPHTHVSPHTHTHTQAHDTHATRCRGVAGGRVTFLGSMRAPEWRATPRVQPSSGGHIGCSTLCPNFKSAHTHHHRTHRTHTRTAHTAYVLVGWLWGLWEVRWRAYEEDGAAGAPHEVEKRAKVAPVLHEASLRLIPAQKKCK
jgi:hypothetical protein